MLVPPGRMLGVDDCRWEFGFGVGGGLYHPWAEALSVPRDRRATLIGEFYSAMEKFVSTLPSNERISVQQWKSKQVPKIGEGQYEPKGSAFANGVAAEAQARQLSDLEKMLRSGFRRAVNPRQRVRNCFFESIAGPTVSESSARRCVLLLRGQHRSVILARSHDKIPASDFSRAPWRVHGQIPNALDCTRVDRIPVVRRGVIDAESAARVLSRVLSGMTQQMAEDAGLPFA